MIREDEGILMKLEDKWSPVALHTILEVGTSVPVPNDHSLFHSYTTLCLTNSHFHLLQADHEPGNIPSSTIANFVHPWAIRQLQNTQLPSSITAPSKDRGGPQLTS